MIPYLLLFLVYKILNEIINYKLFIFILELELE